MLHFSLDHVAQLKDENPKWIVVEESSDEGKMWSMSAVMEKSPYEEEAVLIQAKYLEAS